MPCAAVPLANGDAESDDVVWLVVSVMQAPSVCEYREGRIILPQDSTYLKTLRIWIFVKSRRFFGLTGKRI